MAYAVMQSCRVQTLEFTLSLFIILCTGINDMFTSFVPYHSNVFFFKYSSHWWCHIYVAYDCDCTFQTLKSLFPKLLCLWWTFPPPVTVHVTSWLIRVINWYRDHDLWDCSCIGSYRNRHDLIIKIIIGFRKSSWNYHHISMIFWQCLVWFEHK